jgi:DNA replication protein DnaC
VATDELETLNVVDGQVVTDLEASIMQGLARRGIDPERALDPTPVLDPRGNVMDHDETVAWRTELTQMSLQNVAAGEFDLNRLPPLHEFTAEWVETQKRDPQSAPILVLFGDVGCGKTTQAIAGTAELAMHHARAGRIYCWYFITHRNFSAAVRSGKAEAEALMDRLMHADLVVKDDLGDYNTQDFGVAADYTSRLINHRAHFRLPTIYTTNLLYKRDAVVEEMERQMQRRIATLADTLDDRAISRLMGGWTAPLPEIDHRAAQGRVMGQ